MTPVDSRSSALDCARAAVARRDVRAVRDAYIRCATFARGHEERCVAAARRYLARLIRAAGQDPAAYFKNLKSASA